MLHQAVHLGNDWLHPLELDFQFGSSVPQCLSLL